MSRYFGKLAWIDLPGNITFDDVDLPLTFLSGLTTNECEEDLRTVLTGLIGQDVIVQAGVKVLGARKLFRYMRVYLSCKGSDTCGNIMINICNTEFVKNGILPLTTFDNLTMGISFSVLLNDDFTTSLADITLGDTTVGGNPPWTISESHGCHDPFGVVDLTNGDFTVPSGQGGIYKINGAVKMILGLNVNLLNADPISLIVRRNGTSVSEDTTLTLTALLTTVDVDIISLNVDALILVQDADVVTLALTNPGTLSIYDWVW